MKQLLICIPLFLFACKTENKNVSNLSLPFKERGINLMDSVTRQFEWNEQTLQIKYREYSDKEWSFQSPVLFSVDEEGKTIDSLQLFERRPYVGTDTYYLPWIEISKKGIITTTDTSFYYTSKPAKTNNKEQLEVQEMYRERAIHVEIVKISSHGKFSKIRKHIYF
ncbi:MAG: hypothetical protein ACO1N0_16530 [Fluviicola sp.]